MANIDVLDLGGEKVGSLELADEVFAPADKRGAAVGGGEALSRRSAPGNGGDQEPQAGLRFGQEAVEAEGHGPRACRSVRSPLWRHGGTVHGPQPRSYDYAFPRKKLLGALRAALASKLADGKLIVVDSLELKEPKTKLYRAALNKLKRSDGPAG